MYYKYSKAQWLANTDITPAHDSLSTAAGQEFAAFIGSKDVIEKTLSLLARKDELDTLQVLQLNKILLGAAHRPGTIPEVVDELIAAETQQTSLLYGFNYTVPDRKGLTKPLSTNDIDRILVNSTDIRERLTTWEASKEVGKVLKGGLTDLQRLRNRVAREMGYSSFFALEVADYGMTTEEMMALMRQLNGRDAAAVHRIAYVRPARACQALPAARAGKNTGTLASQPMGSELAWNCGGG